MAKLQYNKREFRTQDSGLNHGYFNPTLTRYLRVFFKKREGDYPLHLAISQLFRQIVLKLDTLILQSFKKNFLKSYFANVSDFSMKSAFADHFPKKIIHTVFVYLLTLSIRFFLKCRELKYVLLQSFW